MWLTNKQLAAIGSVVAVWSWLDLEIENLMATLAQGDAMLIQALTEDLSPDNRLNALRRLITTWERACPTLSEEHKAAFAKAREVIRWVAANKARRNRIAHSLWSRTDDETMFGWKHHIMPRDSGKVGSFEKITTSEITAFSKEIGRQQANLSLAMQVLKLLPVWPSPTSLPGIPDVPGLESLLSSHLRREWP